MTGIRTFQRMACFGLLALGACLPLPAQNAAVQGGTVASIDERGGSTYLRATLDATAGGPEIAPVAEGMSVRLVIATRGGQFTPTIGTVESVKDATHIVVRVDPSSLEETWKDPSDLAEHPVREYLKVGARIALEGGRSGRRHLR